ncbi:P-II family nitrogen regulator [Oxalobacteraceae bacterium R-40]|uniref:P-II family nitrogen regulator n=1 Tax=Keguizhuia sedimenti TaxID=3064264 RepID=A0ABU1BSZ8_9BURK|nr:P-II family nitrogen regulator [Oxalobacteraceae bacterium R-40]
MKQIIAVIQPHRVHAVEKALEGLPHLPGFTLFPARGHARGHGLQHQFTADEWNPDMHDRSVLLIFCPNDMVDAAVEAIRLAAHTGNAGDGLITVSDIEGIVRIRTNERGDAAL